MVKGLKVLLLVVSVFLIVGCMDYRFNMTVNQDKSVDISMNMEMDMFEFSKNIFYDEEMRNAFFESMFKNCALHLVLCIMRVLMSLIHVLMSA